MNFPDIVLVLKWWLLLFLLGGIFLPITYSIFNKFFDKGYVFSKIIAIAFISYSVFILGFLKILTFETQNILLIIGIFVLINFFLFKKNISPYKTNNKNLYKVFFLEELMFLGILFFWSFVHAYQPQISGLEKYMDFGFVNSILRSKYFPPLDMWFTPFSINYYYFGHLITALLTKLSFISSSITFNLMLSTISALSFVSAFSIGANLINFLHKKEAFLKLSILGGIITAFILNFAGNLHTIYLFFKPYENENPLPFWQLIFSPNTFPNTYWYPNATRFIENTIHEFPIYSYVVSDLHGHVLGIPFVLLTIAVLLSIFLNFKSTIGSYKLKFLLISFLLAIMYMTNAWDGIIYFLLTSIFILYLQIKSMNLPLISIIQNKKYLLNTGYLILFILAGFFIFSLPFNLNFKPFASGIGILCAPSFLTEVGRFGPFLFEENHCQRSPIWQLIMLYGFFYFWIIAFFVILFTKLKSKNFSITISDAFILILILISTLLIIIPEFIYIKDIYPAHYRANTMFKLVYQSFIMLSIVSSYIFIRIFLGPKPLLANNTYWKFGYLIIGISIILIVLIYPYFAINSYFGNLKEYLGLNGTNYLKAQYPNDYEAISWLNKNIKDQPVILEAQGDSYTDYGRVSTNTGLPTVLGWVVHEWLWRGTYDIPAPRIDEVQKMYESNNLEETKNLLSKYKVAYVFLGDLEKQKYPSIDENKFSSLGKIIYQNGETKIFKINN